MKVAIVGYGNQGRAAYEYWSALGHDITVCDGDKSLDVPGEAEARLGPDHLKNLAEFDLIVRSPIVRPDKIAAANNEEILSKVTSVTNEFFRVCPTKNIIGVTGTKGKGTTTTLIAAMLEAAGKRVHIAGNIGTPPLDLLKEHIQPDDWVVLELANFQLIDFRYAPKIGVCVMVKPEHLDWHPTIDEYFFAKKQMFARQKADNIAIYYHKNKYSADIAGASPGRKIPYYHPPGAYVENDDIIIDGQSICSTGEIKLLGRHNWQNICAALSVLWQIEKNVAAARKVLTTFKGLPFRIELRGEVEGVKYYNDSFASGPGATIAAIEAVPEPKILLVGGYDRGIALSELADALINNDDTIKTVLVFGASSNRIAEELRRAKYHNFKILKDAKGMDDIVLAAKKEAKAGDAVVLSPGFASFDMFKNFEARGHDFNRSVEKL
ncbi:UDP-N-acetylmuramoyl-L-alanine--D-glutamate ligase [Candidatus Parcubacteria bacterium]|nr:UDP-N-acetylmuramoyl-L-alanine--D-glutamate ligase [Candidatus Parcubacteria bacterium]